MTSKLSKSKPSVAKTSFKYNVVSGDKVFSLDMTEADSALTNPGTKFKKKRCFNQSLNHI